MRVCHIANPNSIHIKRWIRYFAEQGHEIHLIGDAALTGEIPPDITFYDLTAHFNVRKLRYLVWARVVRRTVREIQPDILHAHQVASAGWLGAAAGWHPFLATAWGSDLLLAPRRSTVHRQLARWVLRKADYVTCVSNGLAEAARSLGADPHRLEVAPWGVDTEVFYPAFDRVSLRIQLGLGDGPMVLSLRAMKAVYNPLDVAHAIPIVLDRVPAARFLIFTYSSDPDLLSQFQRIVQEHKVTHAVRYIGDLPNDHAIADVQRAADVAVSVPASDGTPLSVLEALACGSAVVLSDVPSLHEWVRHEREALFVPVGDAAAIGEAIVRLLVDEPLREKLRVNGPRMIQNRADRRKLLRHYADIYRKLIEQPG